MSYMNYEERLEVAKRLYELSNTEQKTALECIFPELCESEDEKIRKEIMEYVKNTPVAPEGHIEQRVLSRWIAWLEKQKQEPMKVSIWKHWKDGICGNREGKLIYLVKNGNTYSLSSCLGFECDYIELSDLDNLMLEKQGTSYTKRDVDDAFVEGMALAKDELEKQGEQKPAWSEEDEVRLQACIDCLQAESLMGKVDTVMTTWLKSLKERIEE